MKGTFIVTLAFIVCIILFLGLDNVEGRGGRGGGGRGGSRGGSRFGSRSRTSGSSTSRRSSSVRSYRGPTYSSGMWKAGLAAGVVFGLMSYKRRSLYIRNREKEPNICFNEDNLRNGTYGYFICPEPDLSDNYTFCCGEKGEQSCCTYASYKEFKENQKTASIVGSIVGIIVIAIIIGVVVYCCIIKKRRRMAQANAVIYKDKGQDIQEQQPLAQGYGQAAPMQTFNTGPAPPPGAYVAPPMGPPTGGLPYSPSPIGPQSPPPAAGPYPPPQAPPPGGQYPQAPPPGDYPPPPGGPVHVGFKDGADGLPYPAAPYPPPGAGGFVAPPQGYPPADPTVPPPPYSST